ncbi:MAG TPA: Na+/H+ antiporter subunit E [Granulicella sp.]|jgi:multisubunit Na+/H+ antiporter MnhE subunit|nr:Na+/H+ antiporter subunit E [Granulicella sp.]
MAADERNVAGSGVRTVLGVAMTVAVMAGGWILLVAGTKPHELIVGAVSVSAAALFLYQVKRSEKLELRFRLADVTTGWRVPGYLAVDIWVITKILVLDLLRIKRTGSHYRVWGFKTSKKSPVLAARRVLATLYTTTTPNSIVVGIDYERQRILIHQMERSRLTATERELGAKPFEADEVAAQDMVHKNGIER